MNESTFDRETRAYEALRELLAKAREVRSTFEAAELDIPPPLARMLGASSGGANVLNGRPRMATPPLKSPPRPANAEDGWIWIDVQDLQVQGMVLAVLHEQGDSMSPRSVIDRAIQLNPDIRRGSAYNVGPRLIPDILSKDDGKWRLVDGSKAPTIHQGFAWGPADIFLKTELAEHRRNVILHILRASSDGLMQMQIVRLLVESGLCKSPISKDLVKMDVQKLHGAGKIKRVGRTKKWTDAETE